MAIEARTAQRLMALVKHPLKWPDLGIRSGHYVELVPTQCIIIGSIGFFMPDSDWQRPRAAAPPLQRGDQSPQLGIHVGRIFDPQRKHVVPNRSRYCTATVRLAGHAVQVTVIRLQSRLIGPSYCATSRSSSFRSAILLSRIDSRRHNGTWTACDDY
jgi:hypothetical protein